MDRINPVNIASEETYRHGDIIYEEGSSGNWIYVVQSGGVEISRKADGKQFIMEVLEKGDIFGEIGFMSDVGRVATARAVGGTTVGIIDKDFLDREFNRLSEDFRLILVATAHRVKKITDRACDFTARKERRVPSVLQVIFKFGDTSIDGYLANISTWGLFIKTDRPLKAGQKFSLKLNLPDIAEPVKLKCEVVWERTQAKGPRQPPGMGIKFRDIDMKDYKLLKQYVERQA